MSEVSPTRYDSFEIGGEQLFEEYHVTRPSADSSQSPSESGPRSHSLEDIRVRVGTLLKTDNVSVLLGAGSSVDCGGELIGTVPLSVERQLVSEGMSGTKRRRIRRWLKTFYLAVRCSGDARETPLGRNQIINRHSELNQHDPKPLMVNFERVLGTLHRWLVALPGGNGRLRIDGIPSIDISGTDLSECLVHATKALARECLLPKSGKAHEIRTIHTLVRKLLTRPLNLKRVNVFTLNYDTLVEQAADASGAVLIDGFVGTQKRVFRPESYEQDLYYPAETTEGRVHRFDRVLHLYKLHGSITWTAHKPTLSNPYGVQSSAFNPEDTQTLLIYPTPAKYGETLGVPYSEMFRRFAGALVRPQSALFAIGYGFGDDHVNAIIHQALSIPSFTLVIVDPFPESDFVKRLRDQRDRRVWICRGPRLGTIAGFVDSVLPDLSDEEIQKKVVATHTHSQNLPKAGREEDDGMSPDSEIGRVVAVDTAQVSIELNPDLRGMSRTTYEGTQEVGRINSYIVLPVGLDGWSQ